MAIVKQKVILFDFDGTIADTVRAGVGIFNKLAGRYGFLEITPENEDGLREKGPREVMKELSISRFRAPFILRRLRKGLREKIPTLKTVHDMRIVLVALKKRGHILGIVTSNSKENVLEFLKNNRLEFFDHIQAGAGLFRKSYAIKKTMVRNGLKKSEVVFVGDEIRDVKAAQKRDIKVVAVTWGTNSRKGLERANPDFIVDNARELLEVL